MSGYSVFPVTGLPELREGDDLAALILDRVELEDGDIVVVAQKAISKIEGRIVRLDDLEPSERASEIAGDEEDPRRIEAILREAKSIVRIRPPLVICETQRRLHLRVRRRRCSRTRPSRARSSSCRSIPTRRRPCCATTLAREDRPRASA